jgi:hypothetical protein
LPYGEPQPLGADAASRFTPGTQMWVPGSLASRDSAGAA